MIYIYVYTYLYNRVYIYIVIGYIYIVILPINVHMYVCVKTVITNGQLFDWSFWHSQGARGLMDGTGQRRPIHDVVQTYLHFGLNCWPSCSSLINFAAWILQFDQFDQFCCINPPGDLGYSRHRQAQLSNVPTQITNSHSVFPVLNLSWLHRDSVSTEHKVMSGHFPVSRVKILSSELSTSRM